MQIRPSRRHRSPSVSRTGTRGPRSAIQGTARVDRRTKDLVHRAHPGNIAVIDHADLDRVAAESLLEHGVSGVVNATRSISGRYPNLGPLILVRAGVVLLDDVGSEVFDRVSEGDQVRLEGDTLMMDGEVVAKGTLLDEASIVRDMDAARAELSRTVETFAENTMDYVRREQDLLIDGVRVPELVTSFKGRYALVVVRGYNYKEDLHALRGFIREMRPVIVAVDGAADACLAEGFRPDVIFGDMDSVSTRALSCGAELLVHGYTDGEAPGAEVLQTLNMPHTIVTAPGTSEDVAMLLSHEQGAELVVAVGSHSSTIEMLDKGRKGMASTFLIRMRLGPNLVDAKGLSQLYRTRVRTRDLIFLVAAALLSMTIVSFVVPPMRLFWEGVWDQVLQLVRSVL